MLSSDARNSCKPENPRPLAVHTLLAGQVDLKPGHALLARLACRVKLARLAGQVMLARLAGRALLAGQAGRAMLARLTGRATLAGLACSSRDQVDLELTRVPQNGGHHVRLPIGSNVSDHENR
jgi:hypothetical protein